MPAARPSAPVRVRGFDLRLRHVPLGALPIVVVLLAGCTGAPHPSPSATRLPSGITAALVGPGADAPAREARVRIHNGAEDALRIGEVEIEDPRWHGTARRAVARESEVAGGGTLELSVPLPAMDCHAPDEGITLIEIEFGVGASESVARFEIDDTAGLVPALHRRECRAPMPG